MDFGLLVILPLILLALAIPLVLTVLNILHFGMIIICDDKQKVDRKKSLFMWAEFLTLFIGWIDVLIFMDLKEITNKDWKQVLSNRQIHTPIATWTMPTIIVLFILGIIGYMILTYTKIKTMPPLVLASGMGCLYIGDFVCGCWIVQMFGNSSYLALDDRLLLSLLPANLLMISMTAIVNVIREWKLKESTVDYSKCKLPKLNKWFEHAYSLPIIAFILMIPILSIMIVILVLFGQKPDGVIKAWTETSDWNLSKHIAQQNIIQDEHYLCTVAAGGHKKIVKPIRLGIRHGHTVIVNRQLCIANAFEQIIEEKTPKFHKSVRYVYDRYGYPIAKLIHSKGIADVVYFLMKPLEYIFLIIIYMVDVNPENRIAMQYITPLPDSQAKIKSMQ